MPASLLEGTTMPTRGAEACVFMHALSTNMYTKALHRPGTPSPLRLALWAEREEEERERWRRRGDV